jgi:hypothetical protein
MTHTIIASRNGKVQDTFDVLDLPTLRNHVADGHPTDSADLLLYFFLREHSADTPDGTPGISYSLHHGRKKILDGKVKGVSAALLAIDSTTPTTKGRRMKIT